MTECIIPETYPLYLLLTSAYCTNTDVGNTVDRLRSTSGRFTQSNHDQYTTSVPYLTIIQEINRDEPYGSFRPLERTRGI